MLDSIKSIQAQQMFRVQPVNLNDGSNGRKQNASETNIFANNTYNLNRPSVDGNPNLGRSLDLFG